MTSGPDRLALLRADPRLTGIDFVVVSADQRALDVHFLKRPSAALQAELAAADVVIAPDPLDGPPGPAVTTLAWSGPAADRVLTLGVAAPGGFGFYRLSLGHADLDPYFNRARFSFKANCPSPFDCAPPEPDCPPLPAERPLFDYQARDFESYRKALFDFASARWPDWSERHETDVGVMLVELMAALGDELAYYQDRVAWEAYFGTASQRRSARAHARLVDYEIAPAMAAWTWLDVQVDAVAGDPAGALAAGTPVWAETQAGERIDFEIGRGLAEIAAGVSYPVEAAINALPAHVWDEDDTCLPAGARELHVRGAVAAALPLTELLEDGTPARTLLLRTDPEGEDAAARPARRVPMRIVAAEDGADPLTGDAITRLVFEPGRPTPVELDLTTLTVRGNLLPATAGALRETLAVVGAAEHAPGDLPDDLRDGLVATVERAGPGERPIHRLFLEDSERLGLCWLSWDGTAAAAQPEVEVVEMTWNGVDLVEQETWNWRRSPLGAVSSLPDSADYTLEDGHWARIRLFQRSQGDIEHVDYAGSAGHTLRFGDGEFGLSPGRGRLFRVRHRVGAGRRANLGPEALRHVEGLPAGLAVTVSNPLAIDSGVEAETLEHARRDAPEAWKAVAYRAVRPEDYAEAAERLAWVDRAAARSRWTGSWLSVFTTPDPADSTGLPADRRAELETWLDRFRQAGRDSRVADPVYADLDFEIRVCVRPDAERSEVARRVLKGLVGGQGAFFDPDARSFGDSVERARLEAAIQRTPGVKAVEEIHFRRRGWFGWRLMGVRYRPEGAAEIIRVENDPVRPERGSITLLMEGGA